MGTLRPPSTPRLHAPCRARPRGLRPRTPVAGAHMVKRRTVMVAARVTLEEHAAWRAKAAAAGVSPSRLLRRAMGRTRTWTAPAAEAQRERTRQIARIGNNLNQIARWANANAEPIDVVEIIAHLVYISQTLDKLARVGDAADDAH